MHYSRIELMGKVVDNPKFTPGEKEDGSDNRAWICLAVRDTNKRDAKVSFWPITAFGAKADVFRQHLKKGKTVFIEAKPFLRSEEQPDGSYKQKVFLTAREIVLGAEAGWGKQQKDQTAKETKKVPAVSAQTSAKLIADVTEATLEILKEVQKKSQNKKVMSLTQETEPERDDPFPAK